MWTWFPARVLRTPFYFEMGVSPENDAAGRDGILAEVRRLLAEGIPEEDLESARKNLATRFLLDRETNRGRARSMALYELAGVGFDFPDRIGEAVEEVTLDRVNRAARRYLDPDRSTMVVVGRTEGVVE